MRDYKKIQAWRLAGAGKLSKIIATATSLIAIDLIRWFGGHLSVVS
jgi:hypothetical protein